MSTRARRLVLVPGAGHLVAHPGPVGAALRRLLRRPRLRVERQDDP